MILCGVMPNIGKAGAGCHQVKGLSWEAVRDKKHKLLDRAELEILDTVHSRKLPDRNKKGVV